MQKRNGHSLPQTKQRSSWRLIIHTDDQKIDEPESSVIRTTFQSEVVPTPLMNISPERTARAGTGRSVWISRVLRQNKRSSVSRHGEHHWTTATCGPQETRPFGSDTPTSMFRSVADTFGPCAELPSMIVPGNGLRSEKCDQYSAIQMPA